MTLFKFLRLWTALRIKRASSLADAMRLLAKARSYACLTSPATPALSSGSGRLIKEKYTNVEKFLFRALKAKTVQANA